MLDPDFTIELDETQTSYYQEYRVRLTRDRMAGRLKRQSHRTLKSVLELAERQGLMLAGPGVPDMEGGFPGLPQVLVAFPHKPTGLAPWYRVHEALELTRASFEQYETLRAEELEEVREEGGTPRFDSYRSFQPDGSSIVVPVANWQMVMLLFLSGPQRDGFFRAMQPRFREAMVASGLGEALGPVVVRPNADGVMVLTGETITDVIIADGLDRITGVTE